MPIMSFLFFTALIAALTSKLSLTSQTDSSEGYFLAGAFTDLAVHRRLIPAYGSLHLADGGF